jgi:hypothetical protein
VELQWLTTWTDRADELLAAAPARRRRHHDRETEDLLG